MTQRLPYWTVPHEKVAANEKGGESGIQEWPR